MPPNIKLVRHQTTTTSKILPRTLLGEDSRPKTEHRIFRFLKKEGREEERSINDLRVENPEVETTLTLTGGNMRDGLEHRLGYKTERSRGRFRQRRGGD